MGSGIGFRVRKGFVFGLTFCSYCFEIFSNEVFVFYFLLGRINYTVSFVGKLYMWFVGNIIIGDSEYDEDDDFENI